MVQVYVTLSDYAINITKYLSDTQRRAVLLR